MLVEIKTPMLPESVSEATVQEWLKNAGDAVVRDDILVMIETDKVALEVPSPNDGTLSEVLKVPGDTIFEGDILAHVDTSARQSDGASEINKAEDEKVEPEPQAPQPVESSSPEKILSPAAKRVASENQIDANEISGTGKDGRVTKADVEAVVESRKVPAEPVKKSEETRPVATKKQPAIQPAPVMQSEEREIRRQPMSRIRRTIAYRLVQAQQTAALLTTFNEVDLTAVINLRKNHRDAFEAKHGARLGFMSFFVKAAVESLQSIPAVNAIIEGDDLVYHNYCDVGIAVSSPRGLVVPILRDAQSKSFAQIEQEIRSFGERAKAATLTLDELSGGTFTITNGGVFGSLVSTPIINPPQSAILGMHKIQERPVAIDGQVVIRPMMYLALTYDHRIIDGREAVTFLVGIKESLEDPSRLLLQL